MKNTLPKQPTYQPKDIIQNEIIERIKTRSNEAKEAGSVRNIVFKTVPYSMPVIRMNRDDLYYNLENDRTLSKTKEFIQDHHGAQDDHFKNTQSSNTDNQKDYHGIIFSFISNEMSETFTKYRDQRDPIYITHQGIVANGNTRLACFRELLDDEAKETFNDIECIVIPEERDWRWIRSLVNQKDNTPELDTNYAWYSRAERLESDFEEFYGIKNPLASEDSGGPSKLIFKEISDDMKYTSPKDAKRHLEMLELARDFINQGWEGFDKLTDLDSGGAESNLQAFSTLANGCAKNIKHLEKEHLCNEAFAFLATKKISVGDHEFANVHRVLAQLFTDSNISRVRREIDQLTISVDTISGDSSDDSLNTKFTIDRYPDKTDNEKITNSIDETLVALNNDKLLTSDARKKNRFRESLNDANRSIKANITVNLTDETNLDNVETLIESLEESIDQMKKKIKAIIDTRSI